MEVFPHCELRDLGLGDHHAFLPVVLWVLSFDVSESSGDGKPSRNHSVGPQDVLLCSLLLSWNLDVLNRLRLVDSSTILDDPLHLVVFVWPVVTREQKQFFSFVS